MRKKNSGSLKKKWEHKGRNGSHFAHTHTHSAKLVVRIWVKWYWESVHYKRVITMRGDTGRIRLVKFRHIRSYWLDVSNNFVFDWYRMWYVRTAGGPRVTALVGWFFKNDHFYVLPKCVAYLNINLVFFAFSNYFINILIQSWQHLCYIDCHWCELFVLRVWNVIGVTCPRHTHCIHYLKLK